MKQHNPISPSLQNILDKQPWEKAFTDDNEPIELSIMLNPNYLPFINFRVLETKFSGSTSVVIENGKVVNYLNGKKATKSQIENFSKKDDSNREKVKKAREKFLKKAAKLLTLKQKNY